MTKSTATTTTTFRQTPTQKKLINKFTSDLKDRGGLVGGKKPTVSNLTTLLWMLVCNRELAITDPVSRTVLNHTVLKLRDLSADLHHLIQAYHHGEILEPIENGDVFLEELRATVCSVRDDVQVLLRVANGNTRIAIDSLLRAV